MNKNIEIEFDHLFFSYIKPTMLTMKIIKKYYNPILVSKRGDVDDGGVVNISSDDDRVDGKVK